MAQECRWITIQQGKNTQRQKQTLPPADEIIIVPDLPILQQGYSLQPYSVDLLDIPVSSENQANIDPWKDYRPECPDPIKEHHFKE